eukprot:Gb_22489 [translate_table: standard]
MNCRLWSTSTNREELHYLRSKSDDMYTRLMLQMGICIYDAVNNHKVPLPRQQAYPEHAVGIEDQLHEVIQLLELESERNAVAVILHGFGGIGKTTLADAIFARLEIKDCKFSTVRLFEDIESKPDITKLQTWILQDLEGRSDIDIRRFEDGQRALRVIFEKQEAFLYIDNALNNDALEKLLPMNLDKCKKLRLLLTARNTEIESVLQSCKIKKCHSYHVGYIASPEAMEFLERTLNGDSGGVDRLLVFKVVGSYIGASKDKEKAVRKVVEWRDNGKLFSIEKQYKVLESDGLFFAYDDLPEKAKDPFLEICLFFNGWDWDTVECIVGEDEFGSLQKRSLVENKSNRAIIHDVLLAIGRKRTKEFRLTSANDLCELLQKDRKEDVQAIKGIWLQDNEVEPVRILAQQLDGMHNSLRVLALGDTTIVEGKCQKKFQQLIYFQAGKVPNIPFDIARQEELRFLNYRPGVKDTDLLNLSKASYILSPSQASCDMPSKLKLIELHGDDISSDPPSFEITSEAVKKLKDLIVLKLDGFRGLKKLPEEIRCLSRLKELDLTGCQCVQLPQSLGDLNALQKIRLDSCRSLKELPQSLGKLQSLKCLELQFCESLTHLPAEIGSLSSLHMLDLSFCQSLKEVPRSFCSLSSLQYLNLMSCVNLLELPHCFGDLKALAVLNLEKCENLTSIPDSFGELTSLQSVSLNMNDCKKLTHLPEGFCKLSYIEDLSLARCYALEKLPQQFLKLVNLRRLNLERCIRLSRLPMGFSDLKSLAVLNLRDCEKLEDLCSDFHRLPSLQTLDLRDCPKLDGKWMESVMKIKTVDFVDIKGSQKLVEKWAEIDQNAGAGSSHLAVSTGKDSENSERIIKKISSRFFCDEWPLRTFEGELFHPSTIQSNTVLLVICDFDNTRDLCSYANLQIWKIMEKIVVDEIQINSDYVKIIYVGKYLSGLPTNIASSVTAYASDNSDAHVFFHRVLSVFKGSDFDRSDDHCYFIATEVDEDGKQFSKLTDSWEELIFSKSDTYRSIKSLVESPQDSNINLLRVFLEPTQGTSFPLINSNTEEVNVDWLEGKVVLLFISTPGQFYNSSSVSSLTEMYGEVQGGNNFDIVSIPIILDANSKDFERISKDVPWLIIQNPWLLKSAVFYFFLNDCNYSMGMEHDPILVVVDPKGRISNKNALPMVESLGADAYPFISNHQ